MDSMRACESSVKRSRKLAANVMWRDGVPVAVEASRWTTADEIEEVEEHTVDEVEENGGAGGIGDAGEAGDETDPTQMLSEVQDLVVLARLMAWTSCRRSRTMVARSQWRD